MHNFKHVFKPWFAWKPERIEDYLEEMAAEGWQIDRVAMSLMWYRFEQSELQRIRFCADYQWKPDEEYEIILQDDGWTKVAQNSGWLLWKKEYEKVRPQLYTDKQSLIDRNRKIILVIGCSLLAQFPALMTNAFERLSLRYFGGWSLAGEIFSVMYFFLVMLMIYGLIRLVMVNHSLQTGS